MLVIVPGHVLPLVSASSLHSKNCSVKSHFLSAVTDTSETEDNPVLIVVHSGSLVQNLDSGENTPPTTEKGNKVTALHLKCHSLCEGKPGLR